MQCPLSIIHFGMKLGGYVYLQYIPLLDIQIVSFLFY